MSNDTITWFILVCRDCDGDDPEGWLPMPFVSARTRGQWARRHREGTGHNRWWVRDFDEIEDRYLPGGGV